MDKVIAELRAEMTAKLDQISKKIDQMSRNSIQTGEKPLPKLNYEFSVIQDYAGLVNFDRKLKDDKFRCSMVR